MLLEVVESCLFWSVHNSIYTSHYFNTKSKMQLAKQQHNSHVNQLRINLKETTKTRHQAIMNLAVPNRRASPESMLK